MEKPLIFLLSCIFFLLLTTPLLAVTDAASGGAFLSFAEVLRLPAVSGLLFAIGLSFVLIELMAPGFGFFGIAGLSAFFLYFAAHLLTASYGWLALIVFGIGMLFIMLEALVVTGFAFSGIFGLLAVLGSVIMLAPNLAAGVLTASIAAVLTILIMVVSIRFMKKKSFIRKFVLSDRTDTQSGYTPPNMDNEKYLGREGYTLTQLRPAGTMKLDGGRVDVVSDGGYVDAGVKVRVVGLDGTRILVREVEEA